MQAEVDAKNQGLAAVYDDLDNLLNWTLDVDDYVDLEALRQVAEHPRFDHPDLEIPSTPEPLIPAPVEPSRSEVESPKGLFGRKKKFEEAQAEAEADFVKRWTAYQTELQSLASRRAEQTARYAEVESTRKAALGAARAQYANESQAREKVVADQNARLDEFITNLGYGTAEAIQEYVGIVLANSVYPEHFEVEYEAEFEPTTAELSLKVVIPGPDRVPTIKSYKYTRASDEITTVALSQREAKTRYAGITHQVALRTIHEVFEADRRSLIQAISLEVATQANNPATGKYESFILVAVGASRERFMEIDLSGVIPEATLGHLGAALSKNAFDLAPVSGGGVRRY